MDAKHLGYFCELIALADHFKDFFVQIVGMSSYFIDQTTFHNSIHNIKRAKLSIFIFNVEFDYS